jgi:hypothetical protein
MNTLPIIEGLATIDDTSFDTAKFSIAYQNYIASNDNTRETVMNSIRNNATMIKLKEAYNKLAKKTKEAPLYEGFDEANGSDLLSKYNKDVVKARTELNEKMKQLSDYPSAEDYNAKYNSTMLASTIATIVGSCLLYYTFMHLQ